ncbi:hypothetical protein JTE90_003309 [Oedothorax gibbosus]|uniref:Uncharacterized protein n=1 Tax=Oedothorax gibbosus TaxID=931172 RepID=A0AAV6TX04_9ARAC|nr:hypothetical protein JTE90_003309 [Oedothorax gibbosus]
MIAWLSRKLQLIPMAQGISFFNDSKTAETYFHGTINSFICKFQGNLRTETACNRQLLYEFGRTKTRFSFARSGLGNRSSDQIFRLMELAMLMAVVDWAWERNFREPKGRFSFSKRKILI